MISLTSLAFAHPHSAPVFQDFNWRVERAEAWAVLGPSGCGKTTLLYLLAGLRFPISGTVEINGEPLERPRPRTGLILQDFGLLPWATVRDNVRLGLRLRNFYGPDGKHAPASPSSLSAATVDHWLERLGLAPHAGKFPGQLSGGQRQRAAIARTLVLQPDLLLMDEPFASLDAPTRESLQNLTLELCAEQGLTLVLVTHAIEEAAFLGRKILLLSHPPTREATVIENPGAGGESFRGTAEYQSKCGDLRRRMEMN